MKTSIRTVRKYIYWWIVEIFFLWNISAATYHTCRSFTESVPKYTFTVDFTNILAIVGMLWLIALSIWLNEKYEKRAFGLIAMSSVIIRLASVTKILEFIVLSYICWLVFAVFAYYYLRKAGQSRKLDYIKTPFRFKENRKLITEVIILETIPIIVGILIFIISIGL